MASDAASLLRFLEKEVLPWYVQRRKELEYRLLLRAHVFGESHDPRKVERLGGYEVHFDRKLERMLAMLIQVHGLRSPTKPSYSFRKSKFNDTYV